MPYQNNNNRVTPQATGKYKINPVASPVDRQLRYQPDLSSAKKTEGLANALYQLGQGVYDFSESDFMKKKAEEEAILLHTSDVEAGNNQHEWSEASKRVKGLSKFNPYIKDKYMELAAGELFKKSTANLVGLADEYKHSNEDILNHIQSRKAELKAEMQKLGLSTLAVAPYLKQFEETCDNYYTKYVEKNAEYTHNLSFAMGASSLTSQLRNNAYDGREGQYDRFKESLNAMVSDYVARGGSGVDVLSKVVNPALKATISQIASDPNTTLQLSDLIQAVKDIEIDGVKLSTVDPDFEYNLKQQYWTAYKQRTVEEEIEFDEQVKRDKRNTYKAEREFYETYNTEMTGEETFRLAQDIANKYGIPESMGSFLTDAQRIQNIRNNWDNTKDNQDYLQQMYIKKFQGELTANDIIYGIENGLLSSNKANYLFDFIRKTETAEAKAEQALIHQQYKDTTKFVADKLKDKNFQSEINKAFGKVKGQADLSKQIIDEMNNIENQLNKGEITEAQATKRIQGMYDRINKKLQTSKDIQNNVANFSPVDLMRSQYFSKIPINVTCDKGQAERAMTAFDITRGQVKTQITSMINPNRKHPVKGTVQPHRGVDMAMPIGTPLYLPRGFSGGTVVCAGFEKNAGNYVLIRLEPSGDFMKVMHLKSSLPTGSHIGQNTIFARSGNTGIGTGAHAHIEFWESDGTKLYDPRAFAQQMNQPSQLNKKK